MTDLEVIPGKLQSEFFCQASLVLSVQSKVI